MTKSSKSKSKTAAVPKVDPYLEGLMAKLLERLVGLERKVDTVISQTGAKPSANGESSKPFQAPQTHQPHPAHQSHQAPPPQRRDRTLYEAICADCHKVCEVPFRPVEGRSVYCKECFAARKAGYLPSQKPVVKPAPAKAAVPPSPPHEAPKAAKKSAPAKRAKKKK